MEFTIDRRKYFYRHSSFYLIISALGYALQISTSLTNPEMGNHAGFMLAADMLVIYALMNLYLCSTHPHITIDSNSIKIGSGRSILEKMKFSMDEIMEVTRRANGHYQLKLNNGRIEDLSTELLSDAQIDTVDDFLRKTFAYSDSPSKGFQEGILVWAVRHLWLQSLLMAIAIFAVTAFLFQPSLLGRFILL